MSQCFPHNNKVPWVATSDTGRPVSFAMNPTTLKITKPAKTLVPQLPNATIKASLLDKIRRLKGDEIVR